MDNLFAKNAVKTKKMNEDIFGKLLIVLVPGVGLEPTRSFPRRILNPLRLPISPPRH